MPLVLSPSFVAPAPPTTSTGPDGHLTALVDQTYDGVWLKVDYSATKSSYPAPFRATIYRVNPDGSTVLVRSGEVLGYSAVCYAYDHEAPLGQAVRYYVVPDGGTESDSVVVTIPARAGGGDDPALWIKCLDDPSLSLRVWAVDTKSADFKSTSTLTPRLGNRYPSAILTARQAKSASFSFYTRTMEEYDQVEELLRYNRVLIQSTQAYARRDGYFLVLDAGATRASELAVNPLFLWTAQLQEIERPDPSGQSLAVPGYSFADDDQDGDLQTPPPYATFEDEGAAGAYINMLTRNMSSFEVDVSDWGPGANTTLTRQTNTYQSRPASARMTSVAAGGISMLTLKVLNVAPGQKYTYRAWVRCPVATTMNLELNWRDSAGVYLDFDSHVKQGGAVAVPANVWTQISLQTTAIASAVGATLLVTGTATGAAQQFGVDDIELAARQLASIGPYNQYGLTFEWAPL